MPVFVRPLVSATAFVALLCFVASCSPPQDAASFQQVVKGVDNPESTFAVQIVTRDTLPVLEGWPNSHPISNYGWIAHQKTGSDPLIQSGDKLTLAIWDNDETSLLSQPGQKVIPLPDLQVSSKGTIFLPYVDEVYVAKMTPDEARRTVQSKLTAIIPSAQVQLSMAAGMQNSVEVVAGMPVTGKVPLTDRSTTITSVLAQSGGIPSTMTNAQVNLQRGGRLYKIAADTLFSHPELDTTLRGGDKIFVETDKRYFLSLGAAGKEAVIDFPRDSVTALDAMSLVGGVNGAVGNPKGVLVLRNYPEAAVRSMPRNGPPKERMIFAFNLTNADGLFSAGEFQIQDRDLVLVTESPLYNTRTVVGLVMGIFNAGRTSVAATTN
jgi:polysaccharide export outer membrane protein